LNQFWKSYKKTKPRGAHLSVARFECRCPKRGAAAVSRPPFFPPHRRCPPPHAATKGARQAEVLPFPPPPPLCSTCCHSARHTATDRPLQHLSDPLDPTLRFTPPSTSSPTTLTLSVTPTPALRRLSPTSDPLRREQASLVSNPLLQPLESPLHLASVP
jgi:hypothetical protein